MKRWDYPSEVRSVLESLHRIIQEGRGAMYVHCWYGVHASGYIAAVALMQFCGFSPEAAVEYWNSNVAASIRYEKVQNMIRAFKPYPDLEISPGLQARVCPR
jgi:hypothetical protein